MLARAPRDEDEFRMLAPQLGTVHIYRQGALASTLRELVHLKEPWVEGMRAWVQNKLAVNQRLVDQWTEPDPAAKSRSELFKRSRILWGSKLPDTLGKLEELIAGPFCVGEELCPADYTLGSWLERVVHASGGKVAADGLRAIEHKVGGGFRVGGKIWRWWEEMLGRPGFARTFGVLPPGDGIEAGFDVFERRIQQLTDCVTSSNI
ncbi:hypothetical protein CALCODRAFT_293311 [Calocera cornea HHB12733]|uniref:GST C-terminal domain-containing protein n=1 Tax=Calocera cornea HHB12733 TaxID=1353952 RepID=A0A165FR64_9BASI|nr:hypothetical protein CALCODRAFT_293311 [Calocera cornea HHB12733]